MRDLHGKTALITGSSRGIGRVTAARLAREGVRVALTGRDEPRLRETALEIGKAGGDAIWVTADLRQEESVRNLALVVRREWGDPDILINNAAVYSRGAVVDQTTEDFDRVLETNLRGVFLLTRTILPAMLERGGGDIIMVASTSGLRGDPGGSAYAASKHALRGFSQSLLYEVRSRDVRVSVVLPSAVDTTTGPENEAALKGKGSRLMAEDVAETILHALKLPQRALMREIELWATNP